MTRPTPCPPLDEITARRLLHGLENDAAVVGCSVDQYLAGRDLDQDPAGMVVEYLLWTGRVPRQDNPPGGFWEPMDDPHIAELVTAWLDWYAPAGVHA